MSTKVKPIPDGFHAVTPHLILKDASAAIEFYKKAFGAEEICRLPGPDGKQLMHASIRIRDSIVMLCDEFPDANCGASPQTLKGAHAVMHLYVEDVDAAFKRAVDAGATVQLPPTDMFWGDRYASLLDPFGQPWSIATHKVDLTPEQMQEGMKDACAAMKAPVKA